MAFKASLAAMKMIHLLSGDPTPAASVEPPATIKVTDTLSTYTPTSAQCEILKANPELPTKVMNNAIAADNLLNKVSQEKHSLKESLAAGRISVETYRQGILDLADTQARMEVTKARSLDMAKEMIASESLCK